MKTDVANKCRRELQAARRASKTDGEFCAV